jgi:V/A-type H+-transporting ATPase subunit I
LKQKEIRNIKEEFLDIKKKINFFEPYVSNTLQIAEAESLIARKDQNLAGEALKLLNFEEITFPDNLNPEPKRALEEVKNNIELKQKEIRNIKEEFLDIKKKINFFEPYVSNTLQIAEAESLIAETKKKSLIHGWIPTENIDLLKNNIEATVPKESMYLKFDNPNPEDRVPVRLENKGVFESFDIFTRLQGVPDYFEINPTPIYTILYSIMFGMMFGDMGGGAVFIILGFLLTRLRKGLFSFSSSITHKLGIILISCGISAMFFGFLYNNFFLVKIEPRTLLNPVQDVTQIMIIALIFGVIQIALALVLNIINDARRKKPLKAIFGSHGIVGLTYYLSGVFLAVMFIKHMNLAVFLQQGIILFTIVAIFSLILVFLSPIIETLVEHENAKISEKVTEGFGEGLEMFISYIANSVSYIRLAAFAIAHEALGFAPIIFAPAIGIIPSLIIMNIIVFMIEGFASFIQSLRLMYYEFSTKFYVGDGVEYKPFKTISMK